MASLPLNTAEHLSVLAREAIDLGFKVCWLSFVSEEMTDSLGGFREGTTAIRSRNDFVAHVESFESVAIFLQSTYPEHYPKWFWGVSAQASFCFAGYGALLDTWEWGHYQLPSLKSCAWLLAESEFVRDKYVEYGNDPSRVVVTGNPLMFELRRRLSGLNGTASPRRTVLWAPHWSRTWFEYKRGYSRWEEAVHAVLEAAKDAVGADFVVRPHPLFMQQLDPSGDEHTKAFQELLELDNVSFSTSGFVDDILRSDVLLTDGIGIIAYFATTGRPMAVIQDSDSPPFNPAGQRLCRASEVVSDADEIAAWLSQKALGPTIDISAERVVLSRQLYPTWTASPLSIWADQLRP
jgi:hypothetical protein